MDELIQATQLQIEPSGNPRHHKPIPEQIVETSHVDVGDNRAKRRVEFDRLQQDFANGFVTSEERDRESQKIFDTYPL